MKEQGHLGAGHRRSTKLVIILVAMVLQVTQVRAANVCEQSLRDSQEGTVAFLQNPTCSSYAAAQRGLSMVRQFCPERIWRSGDMLNVESRIEQARRNLDCDGDRRAEPTKTAARGEDCKIKEWKWKKTGSRGQFIEIQGVLEQPGPTSITIHVYHDGSFLARGGSSVDKLGGFSVTINERAPSERITITHTCGDGA
jgi:hypothetical protein